MTDTERMNWLEVNGSLIGRDEWAVFDKKECWFIKLKTPYFGRPRFKTLREAIDAAVTEGGTVHKDGYVSTACLHVLHESCLLTCEFCGSLCQCGCHK